LGYVHPQTFQTPAGIEMLTRDGNILLLPYSEVKILCFVQDFDDDLPELNNRVFSNRPKASGLWMRLLFRDGARMDGLLPNNLLTLDPHGFTLTPPGPGLSPQRVFVPKLALRSIHVMAVMGSGLNRAKKSDERQITIFE
jgi:hypothetical protein